MAVPPALVPALRRLRGVAADPPAPAAGADAARPALPRALSRLADAAPAAADAALLPAHRVRPQSLRGRGPAGRRGHALARQLDQLRPHASGVPTGARGMRRLVR